MLDCLRSLGNVARFYLPHLLLLRARAPLPWSPRMKAEQRTHPTSRNRNLRRCESKYVMSTGLVDYYSNDCLFSLTFESVVRSCACRFRISFGTFSSGSMRQMFKRGDTHLSQTSYMCKTVSHSTVLNSLTEVAVLTSSFLFKTSK